MQGPEFAHRIEAMRQPIRILLCVLLLLAFGGGPGAAQEPQGLPEPGTKFSGEEVAVGYVLVPVIVRSNSGGYANRLDKKDFRLLVDGRPAPVDSFEQRAEAPASIVFLQDLSGSMEAGGKLEASRRAV